VNKEHICNEQHFESLLRCWRRVGHDGDCMAVLPNVDKNVMTRPHVVRW